MVTIKDFIVSDENAREMVKKAEEIAQEIAGVSTSQIRNIYGTVKKLEMSEYNSKIYRELFLLKPKLAYAKASNASRKTIKSYEKLEEVIGKAIDAVDEKDKMTFKRFCQFFEAILAYHKANGVKNA